MGSRTHETKMQAIPISNPSPANALSPAPAALLPLDPQSPSPFTALFQAVLKGAGNSSKMPPAGKQQDSSREPATPTGTVSNLIALFPQGLVAHMFAPVLPVSWLSVVAAPVPVAPATPNGAATQGAAALSKPLLSPATTAYARNMAPTSGTAQVAAPLSIANPLQAVTDFVMNVGQAGGNAQGPAALSNSLLSTASNGLVRSTAQASGTAQLAAALPNAIPLQAASDFAINVGQSSGNAQGSPALSNPLPSLAAASLAMSTVQANAKEQGPPALSNPLPSPATTSGAKNAIQASGTAQGPPAISSHLLSTATAGFAPKIVEIRALPQDMHAVTTIPLPNFDSEPAPSSPVGVSQDPSELQRTVPGATAEQIVAPAESNVPANSTNVLMTYATQQIIPIPSIGDPNSILHESGLTPNQDVAANPIPWNSSQTQNNTAAPTPDPQNVPSNGSDLLNSYTVQAARRDLSFLNMQTLIPSGAAPKVSVTVPPQPTAIQEAQSNLQPLANLSPAAVDTLAHSAVKSAAIGAPTLKFHENLPTQATNPASPAPVSAGPTKTPSQDLSNGSSGNDSNTKADHASNISSAQTDGRGFVQTLNTATANPTNGHSATADSTPAAAAPVQAQSANSGARPATSGGAEPRPTESLPATPQNTQVVNAAHIVDQPGRTEIRIEMQADSLGGVELRAHIAGDQIGASIAVEHHDAQLALATDLPALHNALAEKNLRVDTLSVSQGTFSSSNGDPGQDHGQRGFTQSPAKFAYAEQPEPSQAFPEAPADWNGLANSRAGLSVVA
jgi:flagellar hook-length control protein FliK